MPLGRAWVFLVDDFRAKFRADRRRGLYPESAPWGRHLVRGGPDLPTGDWLASASRQVAPGHSQRSRASDGGVRFHTTASRSLVRGLSAGKQGVNGSDGQIRYALSRDRGLVRHESDYVRALGEQWRATRSIPQP